MSVQLNHTILPARNKLASASLLAELLELPPPTVLEPFAIVSVDGGRGVYWEGPNGHLLEIITRPYGSGGSTTDNPHPLVG